MSILEVEAPVKEPEVKPIEPLRVIPIKRPFREGDLCPGQKDDGAHRTRRNI